MKTPPFQTTPAGYTTHLSAKLVNQLCVNNIRRVWTECGVDVTVEVSDVDHQSCHRIQSNLINGLPPVEQIKIDPAQLGDSDTEAA